MNEQGFLALVKKNGHYGSQREANRAAHAVFGVQRCRQVSQGGSRQVAGTGISSGDNGCVPRQQQLGGLIQ
jgi:hypothetical protein